MLQSRDLRHGVPERESGVYHKPLLRAPFKTA
jgi:hypothetical protein